MEDLQSVKSLQIQTLSDRNSDSDSIISFNGLSKNDIECCDDCECTNVKHDHKKRNPNTNLIFTNFKHTDKAFEFLHQLRKNKSLCDLVINVRDVEIYCHKLVLVACSPYFHAMFSNQLQESNANKICLKEIEPDTLEILIEYMYTGEIDIHVDNVQSVLIQSSLLQLNNVKESCCEFLLAQMHVSNCLGIKAFADIYSCFNLLKQADAFIEQYFSDVCHSEEFFQLPFDQLVKILSNDHLFVKSEKVIYEAAISWINCNLQGRVKHLDKVMENIRFPLLSLEFLKQISEDALMKHSIKCRDLIIEALLYILSEKEGSASVSLPTYRVQPRTTLGLPKILLVIGGQAPKAIKNNDAYDFRSQSWVKRGELVNYRCRAGVVYTHDLVYLIGGFNGTCRVRSMDIYDPADDTWSQGPEMYCRRSTLGVGFLMNKIFAIGGFDGTAGLSTAEVFDLSTQKWNMIASMSTTRSSVGVVALEGFVYAIGGYSGQSRQCLDAVEKYDPSKDVWIPVANMNRKRSGVAVAAFDGKIYAFGGHNGPLVKKSVEVYDPETNKWQFIADMSQARRNANAVIYNGLFYVMGGDDGQNNLSSVEIYNFQINSWSCVPNFLSTPRTYANAIIVEKKTHSN